MADDDEQQLTTAIAAIRDVQMAELWRKLTAEQVEWGAQLIPNGMQLVYRDDRIEFVWGGDLELFLSVDGDEKTLTGTTLVETLASDAHLLLPNRAPFSHFTFIRGGQVELDGQAVPRPMRSLLAWDLHNVLSYLAALPEPLPYPHKLASTFQQFHVRQIIQRLGVNRGPQGRRGRLKKALRGIREQAGENYEDEVSAETALNTAKVDFWKSVSPSVPPWRFLKVLEQPAEFTRHTGRDTLPGHLADRVLTDILHRYDLVIQRREGEEPIFRETELIDNQMKKAAWRGKSLSDRDWGLNALPSPGDTPESTAIADDIFNRLRPLPGFNAWHMSKVDGLRQEEIAEALNVSQGRVSQLIKKFEEEARTVLNDISRNSPN